MVIVFVIVFVCDRSVFVNVLDLSFLGRGTHPVLFCVLMLGFFCLFRYFVFCFVCLFVCYDLHNFTS